MDDTVWFVKDRAAMEQIVEIVESFFKTINIQINATKSELIIINGDKTDKEQGIEIVGSIVKPTRKEAIRYLGVWLTEKGDKFFQERKIQEKVNMTMNMIRFKKLTNKQTRYIINQVLFPQIEYLLNDLVLSEDTCEKINSQIRQVFKNKCKLTITFPNSMIHASWGYQVFNITDRQLQKHAIDLIQRINENNLCGATTPIRIQQLQNNIWST